MIPDALSKSMDLCRVKIISILKCEMMEYRPTAITLERRIDMTLSPTKKS